MQQFATHPMTDPQFSLKRPHPSGRGELVLADPRATRALVALMDMNAVLGGAASHFGGPAALAELMSALHGLVFSKAREAGVPMPELFHLINDAGHCENGLYALRANYRWSGVTLEELRTFRALGSRLTGHGEAHLFPEGVLLSNGPLGSTLAQAQGLAAADKMNEVPRTTVVTISDGACMEGEVREALASIPGLSRRGALAPMVMIISDNNTKLSGRIDEDSFSMAPTFQSLANLGWKVLDLPNGNNIDSCLSTLHQALSEVRPEQPIAIHARTVKGFGVKKTAESKSGGHGFPLKAASELPPFLKEIYGSDAVPVEFMAWAEELLTWKSNAEPDPGSGLWPGVAQVKIQVGVSKALIGAREAGAPVVSVTSDLPGSTGLADFQKKFPEATLDVGVAESNMISLGAGLSKNGLIPVVDTFAQFGVTKGALPLTMANLSKAPVIAVFSHTGFQDAADGASHQALSYVAMTASLPHTQVYTLSCAGEAEALMSQAIEEFRRQRENGGTPEQVIFFLGRENFPQAYREDMEYTLGRSQVYPGSSGSKMVILAFGSMLREALVAQHLLQSQGVSVDVVHGSVVNRPDLVTLLPLLEAAGHRLLTLEDHQTIGGAGSVWVHATVRELSRMGQKLNFVESLGVNGEFGQSAYSALDLYRKHGLDGASVAAQVSRLLREII